MLIGATFAGITLAQTPTPSVPPVQTPRATTPPVEVKGAVKADAKVDGKADMKKADKKP